MARTPRGGWGDLETGEDGWDPVYDPKSLIPAPPMIEVPSGLTDEITSPLEAAFSLYWLNPSSSATTLRTCVESILTERRIAQD